MPRNVLKKLSKGFNFLDSLRDENIFMVALAASLCLHAITLLGLAFKQAYKPRKPFEKIQVVYQAVAVSQPPQRRMEEAQTLKDKKAEATPDILTPKQSDLPAFMKDMGKSDSRFKPQSKQPTKLSSLDTKRQVAIPLLESEKIMNPRYLNYNERIREKIRNRAYYYVEDPDFEVGEIYLTFVLLANGSLKEVQIIDSKSRANDYLRNIGIRSIKESVPFPPFPSDLKYPELTFNVIISFEVNKK